MSIQALEWARRQFVGDAHGKSLLRAVADYAGEDGVCFPSLGRLAEDCELSEDTVRRKLKALEEAGLLVRIKSWMDDLGRRNTEGRGRETAHEIRLLLGQHRAKSEAGPPPEPEPEEGSQPAGVAACKGSSVQGQGLQPATHGWHGATPGVAMVPPLINSHLKEEEDSSPKPLQIPGEAQGLAIEEVEKRQSEFKSTYPEPSNRPEVVRTTLAALSAAEFDRLMAGARGVKAVRDRNPKKPIVDAAKFAGQPALWDEYAAYAPSPAPPPPDIFVAFGSEDWRAWSVYRRLLGGEMGKPQETGRGLGLLMRRELLPGMRGLAAYADLAPGQWLVVFEGDKQFYAWRNRIEEWIGRRPDTERIWLDAQDRPVATSAQAEPRRIGTVTIGKSRQGLRVPCEWPPPKGDKPEERITGPPLGEISDTDARVLAEEWKGT